MDRDSARTSSGQAPNATNSDIFAPKAPRERLSGHIERYLQSTARQGGPFCRIRLREGEGAALRIFRTQAGTGPGPMVLEQALVLCSGRTALLVLNGVGSRLPYKNRECSRASSSSVKRSNGTFLLSSEGNHRCARTGDALVYGQPRSCQVWVARALARFEQFGCPSPSRGGGIAPGAALSLAKPAWQESGSASKEDRCSIRRTAGEPFISLDCRSGSFGSASD